jgi:hypothetical protein
MRLKDKVAIIPGGAQRRSSMDAPEVRFAVDSPLEQAGFELPVPPATVSL